jgi:hypothetical protein
MGTDLAVCPHFPDFLPYFLPPLSYLMPVTNIFPVFGHVK